MPLYEYKCEGCGETFELRQKFAEQPLTVHDICGGKVHRVLSAPALQFKGSGFYINDYAKGGNGSNKSDSDKKSSDGGKSESKTESKTDSKSESKPESKTESKKDSAAPASSTPSPKND